MTDKDKLDAVTAAARQVLSFFSNATSHIIPLRNLSNAVRAVEGLPPLFPEVGARNVNGETGSDAK